MQVVGVGKEGGEVSFEKVCIGPHTLYRGDNRELAHVLFGVDGIATDPPYGISATRMTLGAGKKDFHRGDWDDDRPDLQPILGLSPRLCFWGGNYFTDQLAPTNDWLVWHKKNDDRSFSECELAWTNFGKQTRHLSHHWSGEEKQHPTMKPLAVMKWTLSFLPEGCTVGDPFMGAGTTILAAHLTGRIGIGIERETKYFDIAAKRIEDALHAEPLLAEAG
jgi:hypothetical protein